MINARYMITTWPWSYFQKISIFDLIKPDYIIAIYDWKNILPAFSITVSVPVKLWRFDVTLRCCYQFPDLSHGTGTVRRRHINTHCNGESNACISVFWLLTQRRMCPGQKEGSIHALYNCGIPQRQIACQLHHNPSRVSRTTRRYQQSRFQFGRPRPGRPRATTTRKYTYPRAMARIWCHLTTTTVLIEWQPILIRVVSVSTVRVRYAEMSLNVQRRNDKLLHSIWVNRAPCGSPGENGPPRICQYPSATPVSIICWHFW